ELGEPVEIGRARQGVDEAAVGCAHLHQSELRDVARDGRLHGVDSRLLERLRDLGLGRERPLPDEPEDCALTLELVHASTSWTTASPCSSSPVAMFRGGVSLIVCSPAVQTRTPRSNAAWTISTARRSRSSP